MKKPVLLMMLPVLAAGGLWTQKQTNPSKNNKLSKTSAAVTEVQSYVHFHGAPSKGKILMVASSPATSKQAGWPVGFWAAILRQWGEIIALIRKTQVYLSVMNFK